VGEAFDGGSRAHRASNHPGPADAAGGDGKPMKLALVAALRTLLNALCGVARNRRAFAPKLEATT
jgi:hypothetical protein